MALEPISEEQQEWEAALNAAAAELEGPGAAEPAAPGATAVDVEDLQAKAAAGERFVGYLKSFDTGKANGFIVCDIVTQLVAKDVYAHQNVIMKAGARVGDTVEFGLHFNAKGMPQASAPCRVVSSGPPPGEFHGTVKSFSQLTNYGFCAAPEITATYGRDAYLAYDKAVGFYVGQEVYFNISLNREEMPVVTEIYAARADEDWGGPAAGKGGKKGGKGDGWAAGKGDGWGGNAWGGKGDSWGGDSWGGDSWGGKAAKGDWGAPAAAKGKAKGGGGSVSQLADENAELKKRLAAIEAQISGKGGGKSWSPY